MWQWLRVGKRVELVMSIIGVAIFLTYAGWGLLTFGDDPVLVASVVGMGAGMTVTLCLPALVYLRRKRKKQSRDIPEREGSTGVAVPYQKWSRARIYGLTVVVTLLFTLYETYGLRPNERLLGS